MIMWRRFSSRGQLSNGSSSKRSQICCNKKVGDGRQDAGGDEPVEYEYLTLATLEKGKKEGTIRRVFRSREDWASLDFWC